MTIKTDRLETEWVTLWRHEEEDAVDKMQTGNKRFRFLKLSNSFSSGFFL